MRNSRRPKLPKDYRKLVDLAEDRGWVLTWEGKHPKLTAPDGWACPIPTTSNNPIMFRGWRQRLLRHPSFEDYRRPR